MSENSNNNKNNSSNSASNSALNSGVAGLANIGVAVAFGALMVSMEQTCAAFIAEATKQRRGDVPVTTGASADKKKEAAPPQPERITDGGLALLQAGRSFALVCLFGIFFMTSTSSLVSKKRIFPMKGFTYLLAVLGFMAFALQVYLMRSIKGGLSDGERTVRFTTSVIYLGFLCVGLFIMNMFG